MRSANTLRVNAVHDLATALHEPGPGESALVGRDDLLVEIERIFRYGARLVTLVGPAGAGKSALARHFAKTSERDVRIAPSLDALAPRVVASEREASTASIIVLDDVDDRLEAAGDLVRRCRSEASGLCFLVTARAPLRLQGEMVVGVGPLAQNDARTLFLARAGETVAPDDPAIDTLLDELDRLPLAIELAAQRSGVLGPADLLARLDDRFRILKSNRRDVPARHVSLLAALEDACVRLSADEGHALAALAIFEGPVAIEIFEHVVRAFVEADPLDLAQALVDASLATTVRVGHGARLTMLRNLRAFVRARAVSLPAHDAMRTAHARFFADRARELASRTYGRDAPEAFAAMEEDLPSSTAAFEHLAQTEPARAAGLGIDLSDLLIFRNVIDPSSSLFTRALEAAEKSGDPRLRVLARVLVAKAALELGHVARAETLLEEACVLARANDLASEEADARRCMAWVRLASANAAAAERDAEAALARHRADDHVRAQADALACRGLARRWMCSEAAALADLEEAYTIHRRATDSTRAERVLAMARIAGLTLQAKAPMPDRLAIEAEAQAHRAHGRHWREALDRLHLAGTEATSEDREHHLELARDAALVAGIDPRITTTLAAQTAGIDETVEKQGHWRIGVEARWIESPAGQRTSLVRHGSARRVLDALVAKRLAEPGAALTTEALLAAGWPGERVRWESGLLRVYTAVRRLRALGLHDVLVTRDDGYLLAPDVPLVRGAD